MDADIVALLRAILRRWLPITIIALTAGVAGYGITYLLKVKFEATSLVLMRPENKLSISEVPANKELLNFPLSQSVDTHKAVTNTYVEIVQSRLMAQKVVDALELQKPLPRGWLFQTFPWLEPLLKDLREFVSDVRDYLFYGRTYGKLSDYDEAIEMYLGNISVEAIKDTHLFEITYFGRTPDEAAQVANATANLLLEYVAQMNAREQAGSQEFLGAQLVDSNKNLITKREALQRLNLARLSGSGPELAKLELDVATAEQKHKMLAKEYEEARIMRAKELHEMRLVTAAHAPRAPAKPKRIVYAGAAVVVALLIGIYLVGVRELTDKTMRSIEDVERSLGWNVLVTVPKIKQLET